jgi:methylase of polypeptide subunit release factors
MTSENNFSYQDCWNYAISLDKNIEVKKIKSDIISLCKTNPENFWLSFSDRLLTASNYSLICHNLNRYLKENYPVPYLTNNVSFYGLYFHVEKGVFIPQKDTEILVERTLTIAEKYW